MVDLPPTSAEFHVIAGFARALERRFPGIGEEVFKDIDHELTLSTVIRLRGPKAEPAIRKAMELARNWLAMTGVIREATRTKRKRG